MDCGSQDYIWMAARALPRLQTSQSPKESGHESFWCENCGHDHLLLWLSGAHRRPSVPSTVRKGPGHPPQPTWSPGAGPHDPHEWARQPSRLVFGGWYCARMGNPILRYIEYIIVYACNIRKYTSIYIKGFSCIEYVVGITIGCRGWTGSHNLYHKLDSSLAVTRL